MHRPTKAALSAPFGLQQPSGATPTDSMPEEVFKHCDTEKMLHSSLRYLWNAEAWLRHFQEYIKKSRGKLLNMRQLVQIGTIDAVLRGRYFLPSGSPVLLDKKDLQRAANQTTFYASDFAFPTYPAPAGASPTPVMVINGDCIQVGLWLQSKGHRTAVLNMASASHPGGGYKSGKGAQEENLHRRTNLFQCLEDPYRTQTGRKWDYPLSEFGGVFSPDVTVLRHSEAKGYAFLEQPKRLSFISAYAYHNPPVETNNAGELRLGRTIANHMRRKIEAIFSIALHNQIDSLVLGALGCGAYCNPPKLFQEVLRSKFPNHFRMVAFGIIDDHNAHKEHNPEGNIKPFADVFTPRVPVPTLDGLIAADADAHVPPAAAAAATTTTTTTTTTTLPASNNHSK